MTSFYYRPDLEMINIITPLLKWNKADAQFYLSISAIVHSYCKWNSNCETQAEVANIVSFLENQAHSGCQIKEKNQVTIEKVCQTFLRLLQFSIPYVQLITGCKYFLIIIHHVQFSFHEQPSV
jgi:hypothetical protein